MTFDFHRPPRPEQARGFELAKDREYHAHFWDPRVGKTGVVNHQFRYNYDAGRVTAMVVIAYPSDVHLIWGDEAEKDFPPEFLANLSLLVWRRGGRMKTKAGHEQMEALLKHDGPKILTMNCEAILTALAWNYLRRFFARNKVLLVVDEDWAVNWSARTKRLLAMGRHQNSVMRRLLTGTPADEGPQNLYYPTTFLKPGALGFTSMAAFKARYFEYEDEKGYNRRTGTTFDIVKGYQNLDELNAKLAAFSDRAIRSGSEKIYAVRYFQMTPKQRAVYDRLRDEYVIDLEKGEAAVADVLTRMTRLQMVARNFYPPTKEALPCGACVATGYGEDGEECAACGTLGYLVTESAFERIDTVNPATEALVEELTFTARRGAPRPFVIWCRFRQDVVDALEAARRVTPRVARYDGSVPAADRAAAYAAFRTGELDGLVATEKSGLSRGHDLRRAQLAVYYSNEWSSRDRRQSEDRTESTTEGEWTDVVDLVAAETRDLDIINALREKRSIAALILGDPPARWL